MHNTLVHALGQGPQGPGTQKRRGPGPGTGPAPFLGPWPLGSLAQSMRKSVVHAQEISCVYTGDSFLYTQQMYQCNLCCYAPEPDLFFSAFWASKKSVHV